MLQLKEREVQSTGVPTDSFYTHGSRVTGMCGGMGWWEHAGPPTLFILFIFIKLLNMFRKPT